MQDRELDSLFDLARRAPAPDADALMLRIEADALALQSARSTPARPPRRQGSIWADIVAALGGRGVLAGLASAALAGVWLGVVQPAPVLALTEALSGGLDTGFDRVELIPALDPFVTEG